MDYSKINKIDSDGHGNIILQDVSGTNISVNYNDTAAIEKIVEKIGIKQIAELRKIIASNDLLNKHLTDISSNLQKLTDKNTTGQRKVRSFNSFIKNKLAAFVGRDFIFKAFDEFRNKEKSGYFIIEGEPGIGKTTFMAKLVQDRGYIHHFNIASQNIRTASVFLENVSNQLINKFNLDYDHIDQDVFQDSGFFLECLDKAADLTSDKLVIAIDSLDEADRTSLSVTTNILFLPPSLPDNVYIIITTRPLYDLHLNVDIQEKLHIDSSSDKNMDDVKSYIQNAFKRLELEQAVLSWNTTTEEFSEEIKIKSQGNFMYLHHVLPAIAAGKFKTTSFKQLPNGLNAYYKQHWRQMKEIDKSNFESVYEVVVCILGVAKEPLQIEQIANWTKLKPNQVKFGIEQWTEFLEATEDKKYMIYHASFQDFLTEQVDLNLYNDMVIDYYLNA